MKQNFHRNLITLEENKFMITIFHKNGQNYKELNISAQIYPDRLEIQFKNNKNLTYYSLFDLTDFLFGDTLFIYLKGNKIKKIPSNRIFADPRFQPSIQNLKSTILNYKMQAIEKYNTILQNMHNWDGNKNEFHQFLENVHGLTNSFSAKKLENLVLKNIDSDFKDHLSPIKVNLAEVYKNPVLHKIEIISPSRSLKVTGFLDTGASTCLIDESLVKKLKLAPFRERVISGISSTMISSYEVSFDFNIHGIEGNTEAVVFDTIERFNTPFVIGVDIFKYAKKEGENL